MSCFASWRAERPSNGNRLEPITPKGAVPGDTQMATVGHVHRTKDGGRQGPRRTKRV